MQRSGFQGIPLVFVVKADRTIGWIGHPERLAPALTLLDAGETIPPEELARISLQQHAGKRQLGFEEFNKRRNEEVNSLTNKGMHAQAIDAVDKLIADYYDMPDVVEELRRDKLYHLGYVSGSRSAAKSLALEIAADDYNRGDPKIASTLIQHYETALPENKDRDFVLWALALMQETPIPHDESDADNELELHRNYYLSLSKAKWLVDRPKEAEAAQRQAISYEETLLDERRKNHDYELNIKAAANVLSKMQAQLAIYQAESTKAE